MARRKKSLMDPAHRAELEEFVARQIAPSSMSRVTGILKGYSDADLMCTVTASNLHYRKDGNAITIGGYVTGNDIETIRLLAEHASTIRMGEIKISTFYDIQRALERLGIMEVGVDSFPELANHLEASSYAYFGRKPYHLNDALMVFVQENIHRHSEIIDYMTENQTNDVPVLRAHFNGEAPVLTEGLL
jgi:hypothetical protein